MSKHDNKFKFEDDDDDDEFFEYLALLLLVALPIVVIYGLCVYCYKQRKLAAQREAELRNEILASRMQTRGSDRSLTIYTVPIIKPPDYNQPNQQNLTNCPNCSCQLNMNQIDSTLPSYDQIQDRRSSHGILSKPT
ncbi:hypothetical protein PVAND_004188 [Polypedilum vanderplanki]|uniref:Uncharacterized protein n=1 Tax=Polypedilum vanderplanki TaxID=319348 RepID=A0A9J6BWY1_POLVA|nr:hypothetical protein PVAND_004188 [Polypedilum vanderplanki]